MKENEYTCASCHQIFEFGRDDEEAREEAKDNFGKDIFEVEAMEIVCDDCYKEIMSVCNTEAQG